MKNLRPLPRSAEPAVRTLAPGEEGGSGPRLPMPGPSRQARVVVFFVVVVVAVAASLVALLPDTTEVAAPTATLPPPIDEPVAEPAEATVVTNLTTSTEWGTTTLPAAGTVADVAVGSGRVAAVGAVDGPFGPRAAAWTTSGVSVWAPVGEVPVPPGSSSSLELVAPLGDGWLALGRVDDDLAVWTASSSSEWTYRGTAAGLEGLEELVALTAWNGEVIVIGRGAEGHSISASTNGVRWEDVGADFGADAALTAAASRGDELFVAGSSCEDGTCRPAIWHTSDALSWSESSVLADRPGEIVALAASASRVVAAGWVRQGPQQPPRLWVSADGVRWRAATPGSAIETPRLIVRALDIDAATGVARLEVRFGMPAGGISSRELPVRTGDAVVTNVGTLSIAAVGEDTVAIDLGGERFTLSGHGASRSLRTTRSIDDVAVQADRILLIGAEIAEDGTPQTGLAWTSTDGGVAWSMSALGPAGGDHAVLLRGRLGVVPATGERISWNSWDADAAITAATRSVEALFTGLVDGDLPRVAAVLPPLAGEALQDDLPAAGPLPLAFWDVQGVLDLGAISATMDYLAALDTSLELDACTGSVRWGDPETVRVSCDYVASSALGAAIGPPASGGRIRAFVDRGLIVDVERTGSLDSIWAVLAEWARQTDPEGAARTFGVSDAAGTPVAPAPSPALAADVLAWADRYVAGLLLDGEREITATPLGTIAWSIVDLPVDGVPESMVVHDGEIIALGYPEGEGGPWALRSADGVAWEPLAGPSGFSWWWDPVSVGDELIVQADVFGRSVLMSWDGDQWTELDLPGREEGDWWIGSVAPSGDTVLVLAEGWNQVEERPLGPAAWVRSGHGEFEAVDLSGLDLELAPWGGLPSVIATDAGYLMLTTGNPSQAAVWTSRDGRTWERAGTGLGIDGEWIETVERLGDRFLALVVESHECEDGLGGPCHPRHGIWVSPDGTEWRRADLDLSGELTLGAGPAGAVLATWSGESPSPFGIPGELQIATPVSLLVSADGETWTPVPDVLVGVPGASWHWIPAMVVGEDTILISLRGEYRHETDASWIPPGSLFLRGTILDDG